MKNIFIADRGVLRLLALLDKIETVLSMLIAILEEIKNNISNN